MKRWNALIWLTLASCQVEPSDTTQIEQDVTDCVGGGNFPAAKMPPIPVWNGAKPPKASATGSYVAFRMTASSWLVALPDVATKKLEWVAEVPAASLGTIVGTISNIDLSGQIDIHPGPVPCRIPRCTNDDFAARVILEDALRSQPVFKQALAAGQ